jgi:para-aminobenzoate synthetase component 1
VSDPRVIFDTGPQGRPATFSRPVDVIRADTVAQLPSVFSALKQAQQDGHWLAGFASYELGYWLDHKLLPLMPETRDLPLLQFGVFPAPEASAPLKNEPASLSRPSAQWDFETYRAAFDRLHAYIEAGDVYQANLTFPMRATFSGSLEGLYNQLSARQPVPHGALVDLGGTALLSRSPELFFTLSAGGDLITRPMKGTAPRGTSDVGDKAHSAWLAASEKNRAENLMIVDLLRNDMSRISEIGSVEVPELFQIETYATVHQMTSKITSRLKENVGIQEIFTALFPCGSITGAPKIRAMEILRELETSSRDAYCGAIGWIAPDGAMTFNVAIRTLLCNENGDVRFNVGGGVVYDSTAKEEYAEALLKAEFATLS